ncbi:hypothetical protein QQ045_023391 [Rhodiola kirilowii]
MLKYVVVLIELLTETLLATIALVCHPFIKCIEYGRDAYGFTVRPQHLQRFKEYASIFKEEEEERSDKRSKFLEQFVELKESYSSEEEPSEKSPVKTPEGNDSKESEPLTDTSTQSNSNPEREIPAAKNLNSSKEELEFLVRGGVPKALQGEVWQTFVGVKARRIKGYYQELLVSEENKGDDNKSVDATLKWKKQIEKDLPRTFPGHPAPNENGRDSLRRVLWAYALHNPSVGYCQVPW